MNISDKSLSSTTPANATHRKSNHTSTAATGTQDKTPPGARSGDAVSFSAETREAKQAGSLPPDQKVVGIQPGSPTDLAKTSGAQAPSQKWNAAEAGPEQSRALYNREGAGGQVSQDVQNAAGAAAVNSTPKAGQLSAPQKVAPTNPQSAADMHQDAPSEPISRSEFIKNLKTTFSGASRS